MSNRYWIAIDVGIKNLGFCVYDIEQGCVVDWRNVSLCNGHRYVPGDNVSIVMQFIRDNGAWFQHCNKLIIEKQIRCNMRIIESVFHTLFYDKAVLVHARNVKMHFGTSCCNYKENKRKAIEFVNANLSAFVTDASLKQAYEGATKKDDMADALLLIHYYKNTFVNNF